jgi:tetratricopeptide (TPR) repeat protein
MAGLSRFQESIQAFRRVLEINPADVGAYVNIATCYKNLDQKEEALENYRKAFELRPSEITGEYVNNEYGFFLARLGDVRKAKDTFQKMVAEGNKGIGYRSLGLLAMYRGKIDDAISNFKQAIRINRAEGSADREYRNHMLLASACRIKGRSAEFTSELAAADRILHRSPLDPWSMSLLAKTYARIGKSAEAFRLLQRMVLQARNPAALSVVNRTSRGDEAAISLVKGEIALAKGRWDEAIESLAQSRQLEPRDPGCLESLAYAYRKVGKPEEAAGSYVKIGAAESVGWEAQEHWILAHYELARIYRERGDSEMAKEYYARFLNIWKDADPDIPVLKQAQAEYSSLQ